jgi:sialic acid synthase SpsE
MTTTYSFDICTELKRVGIKHVKIASPHARDSALIRKYLLAGFKVYVSTGGWNLREIPKLETVSCYMHTVSQYPSDPYKANISRMLEMKQWFPRVPYGFSDHTDPTHKKWDVPVKLALLCGASVIEKHFTVLDRDATKDGVVSIDKKQLEDIVNFSTLSTEDKLKAKPELGLYYYPQTEAEQKLVKKYEGRFKR